MANAHNSEPQAQGLISFKTNFGDIDIELFTKQCPKTTRNFVQLCLDGYYVNTCFSRVEKDFIAVIGETNEENDHVPDEFHSRLRFTRRGLLATANTKKDENGPAIFFTLGQTPELQNKHTIFGRVVGSTVFSLVDLNECQVEDDMRPTNDKRIFEVIVKENPFSDIQPRSNRIQSGLDKLREANDSQLDYYDPLARPKIDQTKLKKLSFPDDEDDDEEEEEEGDGQNKKIDYALETKSISNEPSQHNAPVIEQPKVIEEKLEEDETEDLSAIKLEAREQRLREIREQIKSIKEQIEKEPEIKTLRQRRQMANDSGQSSEQASSNSYKLEESLDGIQLRIAGKKSRQRERETTEIVTKFKKKLREVASADTKVSDKTEAVEDEIDLDDSLAALDEVDGDNWLNHKFVSDDDIRLAKDANTKDESWYSIDDPRRDINKSNDRHHHYEKSHGHHHHDSSRHRHHSSSSSSRSRH